MKTQHTLPQTGSGALLAELCAFLDASLGGLLLAIATQGRLLGPRAVLVWNRVSRARQRLLRLLTRLAERLESGRPAPIRKPRPGSKGGPKQEPLPQGHAWLVVAIGYRAAAFGSHLTLMLSNPANVAAIAASPGAARTLRPLCRMLGVDLPEALRLPPRPPRPKPPAAAKPPKPAPPPAPFKRPIPAYVMAAARAWKRRSPKTP